MINYGRQFINRSDVNAVVKSLKSDFITQGSLNKKFEDALKKKFGSKYCSVFSSATAALHLLALSLKWTKNDTVIVCTNSFLATSNCILYAGANPEFVDIDENFYTINIEKLKKKIKDLKKNNKKISAIICTDYGGLPCDWKILRKIANKNKIKLINDCCHAIGASIDNNVKYAIKYADYVSYSFHPVKNITTGEGGAILTNDSKINRMLNILKSHGVVRKKSFDPWYYQMQYLGYNYRITDFQCALGISQLKKLNTIIKKKKLIAKNYDKAFYGIEGIKTPKVKKNFSSAYHLYPLLIDFKKLNISKKNFFLELRKKKINLQVHYIPIHTQLYYKNYVKFKKDDLSISENFYKKEVSLPIYYSLKTKEQTHVINSIKILLNLKK